MNKKYDGCKVEGCKNKHKGHGYCQNHLYKLKRGTLDKYPCSILCKIKGCFKKSYCDGFCNKHYRRIKKGLPINMEDNSKNHYIRGDFDFEHKNRNSWSSALKQIFEDKCMVCGWNETPCDAHHIKEHQEGGKNTIKNSIILCPNCHRKAHNNILTKEQLQQVIDENIEKVKNLIEENNNVSLDY